MSTERPQGDPSADDFKLRDGRSYDAVTDLFDLFTSRYTQPIARRMVDLALLGAGDRVLDVGTGTAVVALETGRRLGPDGRVVGIDISEGMLASATEKAAAAGLAERVRFERQDAEALTLADASFDCVLSLYALFHFPNPQKALAEMYRVLRPGGTLVLAVGSGPPIPSREALPYVLKRLPLVVQQRRGRWLVAPGFLDGMLDEFLPADRAEPQSHMAQHRKHGKASSELPGLFREVGFVDVRTHPEAGIGMLDSPQEFWDLQRTFSSTARKRFEGASEAQIGRLRVAFFERCRRILASGGKLTYPYAAYILVAQRPF